MTVLRFAGAGFPPLDGMDLSVGAGERLWLQGPSATGKTLALYLAAGLLNPRSGSVTVGDEPPRPGRVAMQFQNPDYQLLAATVRTDVQLNATSEETAEAALDITGCKSLADAALPGLSPGQRRRAALAGVLAAAPPLILLDTPFAGMDRTEAEELWAGVRTFAAGRALAILATGPAPVSEPEETTVEVAQWHS
ncbi:ATP-binding cassette domain-containing protein [Thiohalorhabdus sp.]|uniref:ATP-binding cassette domain-containing protein n=1 Tax=Thiohalorhabdus sp. TaxID=3094134 RepID=UPI002FC33E11